MVSFYFFFVILFRVTCLNLHKKSVSLISFPYFMLWPLGYFQCTFLTCPQRTLQPSTFQNLIISIISAYFLKKEAQNSYSYVFKSNFFPLVYEELYLWRIYAYPPLETPCIFLALGQQTAWACWHWGVGFSGAAMNFLP